MADAADKSTTFDSLIKMPGAKVTVSFDINDIHFEKDKQKVMVIGKAGIGKTSATKGELVTGSVKGAKGARSGAKAGTTEVEKPVKVKIWGTDTEVYVIDTPGMFQTSMIQNFMKGASAKSDYVLLCEDASNRTTLENALQEIFIKSTITEFNNNKRFGVLFLKMNVAEIFAETSGDDFSEEIIRKSFAKQMETMLNFKYQERTTFFYSYGSEAASKKRGKVHWAKDFAKWVSGNKFGSQLEIKTDEILANPTKFMKKVVDQVEPDLQDQAEKIIRESYCPCSIL